MRRSTIVMLLMGAGAAVFSYTPTAAQWLAIGKEQGYIPDQVPPEATDPPVVAAGALTLFVTLAVMLFRFLYVRLNRASGFEAAVAGEAVQKGIEREFQGILPRTISPPAPPPKSAGHAGHDIIAARRRRHEIDQLLVTADEEREEVCRQLAAARREISEHGELIGLADANISKTRATLHGQESERAKFAATKRKAEEQEARLVSRLNSIGDAKDELKAERFALA